MAENNSQDDLTQSFTPISNGAEISHYKVVEKIGSGGMGEVYLALDTKLNRKVALKFLPPHLCQDEDCRKRFMREAQAAAGLDHPNIAAIYEVGEHQGRPFYAMQVVEGQSLKELVTGKDLPIERILEIAIQVCDGLQAAHDMRIIHRDIKPSNILLDGHGRVRIVDFGLAAIRGSEHLTKTGSTLGTIGYMSPEQVQGKEIDHRSDLFSLGVVLFELITKLNPFKRDSEAATLKAVWQDNPEPLARYKSDIPDELQRTVSKLLEKDAKIRYQHADGVVSDLKRLIAPTQSSIAVVPTKRASRWSLLTGLAAAVITILVIMKFWPQEQMAESDNDEKIMLAVLPFENLGDPEDEYFADGITREISSRLASVRNLGVIAHASAATYKNTDKPLLQIADELGVDYILDGSIQWDKSGDTNMVRVAPQLVRVSDQTQIWANNYERTLTRIFEVQADIATHIARTLGIKLTVAQREDPSREAQVDPAAYSYYLKAKQYFSWIAPSFDIGRMQSAEQMLLKASELEPNLAEVHAQLSVIHTALYRSAMDHTPQRLASARASVERALELGPNLIGTHLAMGWFYYYGPERFDSAQAAFTRVLEIEPDNSEANSGLARVKRRFGLYDEAIDGILKAIRFDPRQAIYYWEIAYTLHNSHRHADALHYWDKAIELEPDNRRAHGGKAYSTLHATGSPKQARAVLQEALKTLPRWPSLTYAQAEFFFMDRHSDSALALLSSPDDVRNDYGMVIGGDTSSYYWLKGEIFMYEGDPARARLYYDSARAFLEAIPFDSSYHHTLTCAQLALIYARVGLPEPAVEKAQLAIQLSTADMWRRLTCFYYLAMVYAIIGEHDKAIDQLDRFLFAPSWGSANWLRLEPQWDPLRDDPRFQALIEKYEKEHGI